MVSARGEDNMKFRRRQGEGQEVVRREERKGNDIHGG